MGHGKFRTVRGGEGSSGNLHTRRVGGGYPADLLFLLYFQTNAFSALGTNGTWLRASGG